VKIDEKTRKIQASTEFKSNKFQIGDAAFIIEVLSKKMYSDPIYAVCREIMSNARDAHRELGNADRPIEVTIPTDLNPIYIVRDFGVGITPNRMREIFTQYGISSKRDGNDQTGGFGLGSKTPFAYGDNFTIISITPEKHFRKSENCNVKRTYVAYIGEDRIPVMALTSEEITNEERGTSISLPVNRNDFSKFDSWTHYTAKNWNVFPVVKSTNKKFKKLDVVFSGDKWRITKEDGYDDVKVIIDGIIYPLDSGKFSQFFSEKELSAVDGIYNFSHYGESFHVIVETGEIMVSTSREELEYTDKNMRNVYNVLLPISNEIQNLVENEISSAPKYIDACKLASSSFLGGLCSNKKFTWNGKKLFYGRMFGWSWRNKASVYKFVYENEGTYSENINEKPKRAKKESLVPVEINDTAIIVEDDTDASYPSFGSAAGVFKKNPDVDTVYIFKLRGDYRDEANKNYCLDNFEFEKLSTFEKIRFKSVKKSNGKKGKVVEKTNAHRFNYRAYSKADSWVKEDIDINNGGGVYVVKKRYDPYIDGVEKNNDVLHTIVKICNINKVYGVTEKTAKLLGPKWISVEEVMKKVYDKRIKKIDSIVSIPDTSKASDILDSCIEKIHKNAAKNVFNRSEFHKLLKIHGERRKNEDFISCLKKLSFYIGNNDSFEKVSKNSSKDTEDEVVRIANKYKEALIVRNLSWDNRETMRALGFKSETLIEKEIARIINRIDGKKT